HARRRGSDRGTEGEAREAVGRGGDGTDARRRAHRLQADEGTRQRRADRRPEGRRGERLVRGTALGHGEHLQDLRGELPRQAASRHDRPGGRKDREWGPRGEAMKTTRKLHELGQSIWLDNITRDLLNGGSLRRYIDDLSVTGLTSNPSIFDHAIKNSTAYDT